MSNTGYILSSMNLLTQRAENQRINTFWTLVYIRRGIGMYLLDSDLRPINQGDIIVLPPKISYSFCAEELGDEYNVNVDAVVLRFDSTWLTNLLSVFSSMRDVVLRVREVADPYAIEGPKWMKMSSLFDELAVAESSRAAVIVLQILELISSPNDMIKIRQVSLSQGLSLEEKREKIDRYVSTHLFTKITLEDISEYLDMNRTYFCMFFKKHYGKGFSDYLNDMRVDKAASLLLQEDMSIADIARDCGFKTVPYFNRAFKRSKGLTPGEYRKRGRSL